MAKWIEYTGSNEQIEELASAKTMVRVRYANRQEVNWSCTLFRSESNARDILQDAIAYLICEPHPHADLIKIWADTGCPVWYRFKATKFEPGIETEEPDWFNDELEFKLTPFED